jgi:hypothetical protein
MAYPEPIPAIKSKDAEEFLERLEHFKLSVSQREFFREAFLVFAAAERKSKHRD